jgi:hypothetical protein
VIRALLFVALLSACTADRPSATPVTIVPTSRYVTLGVTGEQKILRASIVITNASSNPILWSSCALTLEEYRYLLAPDRKGSDWTEVWAPGCADVNAITPLLLPGENVTVPIEVVTPGPSAHDFLGQPGVYRVHFFLSAYVGGEYLQLPYTESVSQPFNVVLE